LKALNKVNARGGEADKVARAGANRVRAEIALERERHDATAAIISAPSVPASAKARDESMPSRESPSAGVFSLMASMDLGEEDVRLRRALIEPRFEERKAELDVREAQAVLGVKKYRHGYLSEANKKLPGAVDHLQIDQAKAELDVAEIQLDKAKLALERAHAAVETELPPPAIVYSSEVYPESRAVAGRGRITDRVDPAVADGMTLRFAIDSFWRTQRNLQPGSSPKPERLSDASHDLGPARIAVIPFKGSLRKTLELADDLKPTDGVPLRDVVEGKVKNEIVHCGDFIVLFGGRFWKEKPGAEKPESSPAPK
jgi:hypothetical protein